MENDEQLIESLWCRVEPGIKQLMPKMNQIDLLRMKALVKRVLKSALLRTDSSSLDFADKYLTAGEADSRAASLLFQSGELALSVYHIQQAIEKAMKAFCLSVGDITIDQLRTTHRTPQPLLEVVEQRPGSEMMSLLHFLDNRDYKAAVKRVKKLVNSDQQKLAKLPMKPPAHELSIEVLIEIADALTEVHPVLGQKENEVKAVLVTYLPEYKESIVNYSLMKYGQAAGQCYIFGVLTFPHESYTRYPGGFLEPQDYNQELGIVQAIPSILERTPRTLDLVRDVILILRKQISQASPNGLQS